MRRRYEIIIHDCGGMLFALAGSGPTVGRRGICRQAIVEGHVLFIVAYRKSWWAAGSCCRFVCGCVVAGVISITEICLGLWFAVTDVALPVR